MFEGGRLDQRFRGTGAAGLFHVDVPGNSSNLVCEGHATIGGNGGPGIVDGLARVDAAEYAARRVGGPQVAKALVGFFIHQQELPIGGQFRVGPWAGLPLWCANIPSASQGASFQQKRSTRLVTSGTAV